MIVLAIIIMTNFGDMISTTGSTFDLEKFYSSWKRKVLSYSEFHCQGMIMTMNRKIKDHVTSNIPC